MKKNSIKNEILYLELKELSQNIYHRISFQILLSELEITPQQYLSYFYKKNSALEVPEYFHKDNLEDLIGLLEYFQKQELLDLFFKWGVFFKKEDLIEWLEFYVSIFLNHLVNHKVNLDSLEISLLGCENPYDAFILYCNNNINEEILLRKAAKLYLKQKKIKMNELNLYLLEQYIETCYQKKILNSDFLYKDFFNQLYKLAVQHKLIAEEKKKKFKIHKDPSLRIYLNILEINCLPETKEELKKIYYNLIKKYHPDTNSEGLEKTKKIIEAYSNLIKIYE
ncbi:MAG: DnaJ domain-containing protein [Leptonema sp. (in: bacteria)]